MKTCFVERFLLAMHSSRGNSIRQQQYTLRVSATLCDKKKRKRKSRILDRVGLFLNNAEKSQKTDEAEIGALIGDAAASKYVLPVEKTAAHSFFR